VRRVVVVGAWGAGKSRLAAASAAALGVPLVEHDPLYWVEDWVPRPTEEFRALAAAATAGEGWVADGNFSAARDIVWGRADTLVWLDYALPLVLRRLAWRQVRRFLTREVLWHGNRPPQTLAEALGPRSLVWMLPARHARWQREYPALLASPEFAHLRAHRVRRPADAERLLTQLAGASSASSVWRARSAGRPSEGGRPLG
jgi:hypothetical protein